MTIEKQHVVSLRYTLTARSGKASDEKFIEKTQEENPFVFLFGSGSIIPGFESNLKGKKAGEMFDFYIPARDAYGEIDEQWIIDLPIESFRNQKGEIDSDMLQVGNSLPMSDDKGNQFSGIVKTISEKAVTMDFNHPLAGHELHFTGEVLSVRQASPEEIDHGHVHGAGGHHH